jgi:hypothetical protein
VQAGDLAGRTILGRARVAIAREDHAVVALGGGPKAVDAARREQLAGDDLVQQ